MNVSPISFILQNNFNQKRNTPKFNARNLAPLAQDTVSFSGKQKPAQEVVDKNKQILNILGINAKKINPSDRGRKNVTRKLYDEADFAYNKFKLILKEAFPEAEVIDVDSFLAERVMQEAKYKNSDSPVLMIITRRKQPDSIAEKMAQTKARSVKEAKEKINDIIGARILVTGKGTEGGNYVLERLAKPVQKGHLKIAQVKNHGQELKRLNFASRGKIDKFVETARKYGSKGCQYIDQPRDSGYIALHIITDVIEDGYRGEIQIMSPGLEEFKNVEDICYKCHAQKGVHKKYKIIEEMFSPIVGNERKTADYLEYTKRAYAYERQKPYNPNTYDTLASDYLRIPSNLDIDPELDFNNIADIKRGIDAIESDREEIPSGLAREFAAQVNRESVRL